MVGCISLRSTFQDHCLLSKSSSLMLGAPKFHGAVTRMYQRPFSQTVYTWISFKPIYPKEPSNLLRRQYLCQLPRSSLNIESSPAPKHIIPKAAITTLSLAFLITLLNMNSCAINSTSPVYISIPALILSKTPSTMSPVCDPGAYVFLTPKPTAIDIGVDKPYPAAKRYGVHRFDFGQGVAANRDPRPRPSNVWWNTRTI